jgi:hypothetical protein
MTAEKGGRNEKRGHGGPERRAWLPRTLMKPLRKPSTGSVAQAAVPVVEVAAGNDLCHCSNHCWGR